MRILRASPRRVTAPVMTWLTVFLSSTLLAGAAMAASAAPTPATPAAPSESDWRVPDPQNVLVIDTTKGRIVVEMNPAVAPLSVDRVRTLTRSGVYNGRAFFRVIEGFMDQTGDPLDNGMGGSTLPNLPPEFAFRRGADMPFALVTKLSGLDAGISGSMPVISQPMDLGLLTADNRVSAYGSFCDGVAGMARADAPDSGNSQFYLMRAPNPALDQKYTPWGRVIGGLDIARAIKVGEPPAAPVDKMTTVRVLADIPATERPKVRVIDAQGPWFKAMVERVKTEKVVDFSICDINLPSEIK